MKVYFIGAGPGAADLITVRGAEILSRVSLVFYAGSLVPEVVLSHCHQDVEKINTASLNLEQQFACYQKAKLENRDVARLHSGDPAIYGAMAEQMERLTELDIEYEVVPGVSSFTAAAAILGAELTKPEVSQSIILTRVSGRATQVPEREQLAGLAAHGATLCIFLSGPHLESIVAQLLPHYQEDTPIVLAQCVTWPNEKIFQSTLGKILSQVNLSDWKLTTMILVGDVLRTGVPLESCLYSAQYAHRFRQSAGVEL
jgi:precorrin-4/cobalt-precorrin-4 C11-methyltransferase